MIVQGQDIGYNGRIRKFVRKVWLLKWQLKM